MSNQILDRGTLKATFETGDIPTQSDFDDLITSAAMRDPVTGKVPATELDVTGVLSLDQTSPQTMQIAEGITGAPVLLTNTPSHAFGSCSFIWWNGNQYIWEEEIENNEIRQRWAKIWVNGAHDAHGEILVWVRGQNEPTYEWEANTYDSPEQVLGLVQTLSGLLNRPNMYLGDGPDSENFRVVHPQIANVPGIDLPPMPKLMVGGNVPKQLQLGTEILSVEAITNWNTAYGWGDHSQAGYTTTSTDISSFGDSNSYLSKASTAYGWGDHSQAGYTTTSTDISSFGDSNSYLSKASTAYGWGDHSQVGYVTGTPWQSEGYTTTSTDISSFADTNSYLSKASTAYGWGDHSSAGYLTSLSGHDVSELAGASLPTSDPAVAGQLWNDSGVVKVSTGS